MASPVLLVVDADATVREDVAAQLRRRYAVDYDVETAASADTALRLLAQLADSEAGVALVLVSEAVAEQTGGTVLERAHQLHPHAKRGLMVGQGAFADPPTAQVILDAISVGRIDYYVPLPAGSPDEVFQHTISAFLLEWASDQRLVPQTIHIIGEEWSGRAYELRSKLELCAQPHKFCLADSAEGRQLLAKAGHDVQLPAMLLPDGRALGNPTDAQIALAAGAPDDLSAHDFDVVVVGAGPAGLSAAVYGASEGLHTLVIDEGGIGGQARSSSLIRNYLGFPRGVSGNRLAEQAYEQASVFGTVFLFMHGATALTRVGDRFSVGLHDGRSVAARVVILAAGASYRRLGVASLEALTGAGVFYGGPASEAHGFSGREVFVAGGGNSAGQAALYLARYARQVTILVRRGSLEETMSHYLTQQVHATPNIEVHTRTTVAGGGGEGRLQQLLLRDETSGEEREVGADGLFVLIGASPHTGWLPDEIARDEQGFLYTGEAIPLDAAWPLERRPLGLETTMPGVLAAGDIRHGSTKRVASAVGEGSIAVGFVHTLLAADEAPTPV